MLSSSTNFGFCRVAPLLLLLTTAACAADPGVTIESRWQGTDYAWADSFFMIDTKPVEILLSGTVPSLPAPALENSVAIGMKTAAPITCCAGADDNFAARAPLAFGVTDTAAKSADGSYQVLWHFAAHDATSPSGAVAITASAELRRGGTPLTRAEGKATIEGNQSVADREKAMVVLVRNVEKRLTPFPDWWIENAGGGG